MTAEKTPFAAGTGVDWPSWRDALEPMIGDLVDDLPFVQYVFQTFLDSQGKQADAVRDAVSRQDLPALAVAAHTLKGSSRSLALDDLADTCAAAESASRKGDATAFGLAPELLRRLEVACSAVTAAIQHVGSLPQG